MTDTQPNYAAIKQRQQKMWSSGSYAEVGSLLGIVGELLCEAVDLRSGSRVLDVACGSGAATIPAARRFTTVTGLDYVPSLLERARERAAAEHLEIEFVEGDAEALPFEDGSFDVVLSTFGVMFAPNQAQAARELLRVTRPGGTIGLANWTPEGMIGTVLRTTGKHVPPPAGLRPPVYWGTEDGLVELFGDGVSELRIERRHFTFRFPSTDAWLEFFRTYYGPVKLAFEALDADGQDAYGADLLAVIAAHNRATDGTMVAPSKYLEVVATRS